MRNISRYLGGGGGLEIDRSSANAYQVYTLDRLSQRWQARPFFFLLVSTLEQAPSLKLAEGSGLRPLDDSRNGRGSLPKAAARGRSPPLMVTNIGVLFKTCQRCNTKKVRFGKNGHVQVSF